MISRRNSHHLICTALAIFVTLSGFHAAAQRACERVHSKLSIYKESFQPLKDLNNSTSDFIDLLKSKRPKVDIETLEDQIAKLEVLAENYFKASGIQYEKLAVYTPIKNLKDAPSYRLLHGLYRISGAKDGDEVARMIYGVQSNPKHKNYQLKINFDILYQIQNPDSNGHFDPETGSLFIGPHVLSRDASGISTTLRHEIHHSIERMKVIGGEMTLARLRFSELTAANKELGSYSGFLSVDELETHLRDLRMLMNEKQIQAKDEKLSAAIQSEEKMKAIQSIRAHSLKSKIATLNVLLRAAKLSVEQIEQSINSNSWSTSALSTKTGGIVVGFKALSGSYSSAAIELLGLIPAEAINDRAKLKETLSKTVSWSRARILEIEQEFNLLRSQQSEHMGTTALKGTSIDEKFDILTLKAIAHNSSKDESRLLSVSSHNRHQ